MVIVPMLTDCPEDEHPIEVEGAEFYAPRMTPWSIGGSREGSPIPPYTKVRLVPTGSYRRYGPDLIEVWVPEDRLTAWIAASA